MARLPVLAWIAIAGLVGCGGHPDHPSPTPSGGSPETGNAGPPPSSAGETGSAAVPPSVSPAVGAIDENLARLRALDVFEVGMLVVRTPDVDLNGAAERLVTFTEAAVSAALSPYDSYACEANVEANLDALRALDVVDIGSFILSQAPDDASCQNGPCPDALAAASAENHARAAKLESIATSMPEL